jgi:hypothetical protein
MVFLLIKKEIYPIFLKLIQVTHLIILKLNKVKYK